jgi:putative hydrolase of HD superfamily
MNERLMRQIEFIVEADKLKQIYRQNILTDRSRYETDAEHSWHLALMALLLSEHLDDHSIAAAL